MAFSCFATGYSPDQSRFSQWGVWKAEGSVGDQPLIGWGRRQLFLVPQEPLF
jgi:hypothetical protein